jgi:hypothetical protein
VQHGVQGEASSMAPGRKLHNLRSQQQLVHVPYISTLMLCVQSANHRTAFVANYTEARKEDTFPMLRCML